MSEDKRDVARDLRVMPCEAGGRSYYLDATAVRSVHRKEEWRLNWRSDTPLGWIRHGGEEIPILDLARALGVSHSLVAGNAVLVETEAGPKAWGVGGVGRVVALPAERILPVPDVCWTETSPPWLGIVTGEGTQALCIAPQHLGLVTGGGARRRPAESAGAGATNAQATGRAILFSAFDGRGRLPEVRFCLWFGQVAEFITLPRLVPISSGRPWLTSLVVWRDRSVPVIDLGWGVNGRPAAAAAVEDYLIARTTAGGSYVAVTVTGKPEAVDLPFECERDPAPPLTAPHWFRAAFRREHQLLLMPDFAAILPAENA